MHRVILIIVSLTFVLNCSTAPQANFNHSKFDNLLKKYVDEKGLVNYTAFQNNEDFNDYLNSIAKANINKLSDNNKLAFYINAYNATVIKNVLDHWPIESPLKVDGFFNKIKHKIAGKEMTLDELEHKHTLKIDPVLPHFGLVCAAKSCPKLIPKAYSGKSVINQLDKNAKYYLNDIDNNRVDRENSILYLSEIFKWFPDAFEENYGSLKNAAMSFINEKDKQFLEENEVQIKFIKYNWQLNAQ
ncbi:MAG: DUF547 domain-containing protein [Ignavibacterium sp.]|nr:MAG: DUF547 domain-containing protein [Ignavibacterium sp.]